MRSLRTPLLLFALPAVVLACAPLHAGWFLLERGAPGELWRLWSGHWVHFSISHLAWNLAVLLVAGAWLERVRPGLLLRHTVVAAPLIGVAVLASEPALQAYGGLSGLATGVVVLLGLDQFRSPGATRGLWLGVLALVFLKSACDLASPTDWFAHFATPDVRTSSTAHAAGAITALLHHSLRPRRKERGLLTPYLTRREALIPHGKATPATVYHRPGV